MDLLFLVAFVLEAVSLRFIDGLVKVLMVARSHDVDEEIALNHARVLKVHVREVTHNGRHVFAHMQESLDGKLRVSLNVTPKHTVVVEEPLLSQEQLLHKLVGAVVLLGQEYLRFVLQRPVEIALALELLRELDEVHRHTIVSWLCLGLRYLH